jgi:hypothetical protein
VNGVQIGLQKNEKLSAGHPGTNIISAANAVYNERFVTAIVFGPTFPAKFLMDADPHQVENALAMVTLSKQTDRPSPEWPRLFASIRLGYLSLA